MAVVPLSPMIQRALAVWALAGRERVSREHIRSLPPESFLEGEDPFVAPARRPPPTMGDLACLANIGLSAGPSISEVVDLLRRARGTDLELYFAREITHVPAPDRVRVEAAYLLGANGLFMRAMEMLRGAREPRPEAPPIVDPPLAPSPARLPRSRVDPLAREATFRLENRAFSRLYPIPEHPVSPPPVDTDSPAPSWIEQQEADVARLVRIGLPGGPTTEEAMNLLRQTRRTALGVRALHNVLSAREHGHLAEPIRELCAEILVELGDRARAIEVLADLPPSAPPGPEPPGIDVDSDLREGEAPARAAAAERVMATDATRLGVAERHSRFRAVAHGARLTMDAFLSLGGLGKRDALRASAKELEDAGEPARAGEMYALAGEAREAERIGIPNPPSPVDEPTVLGDITALDRRGLRLLALRVAKEQLARSPDPELAALARNIAARLVRGPMITLAVDDREARVVLGDEVVLGRADATITLASPLLSRRHLRLFRREGAAFIEDLHSHNGTWLAGARISAPIPVGDRVDLLLGKEIPCCLCADDLGGLSLDVAGQRWLVPLGPLLVDGHALSLEARGEDRVVVLRPGPGTPPLLGDTPVDTEIQIARGDVLRLGARRLRVIT